MSLRKIALHTAAMSSVSILRLLAQLLAVPLLSRLLSPADSGIVQIAMPFVFFAMMFADAGVGMSLVRIPSSERLVWSTCFWLSLILGAGLALLMALLAPLTAYFYHDAHLAPILMTLTLIILAQSIVTVPGVALQQDQKFKQIAMTEIAAIISGLAAAIMVAIHGGGPWALVFQQLAFFGVRIIFTLSFTPFRPLMQFNLNSVKGHLSFGRNMLGINIVGFFARSIDNLIIGKVIDITAVGFYSMAFQFARLPLLLVTGPLQYVLYAQLAKMKDDHTAIRNIFLILSRILAIIIFPTMGMIAVAYHPVFSLLLSEKWSPSGLLFMMASPATALQAVTVLGGTVMLVKDRADIQLRTTIEFGLLWVGALLIFSFFGLKWAVIAYNVAVLLYTPRALTLMLPLIECTSFLYLRHISLPIIVTTLAITIFYQLTHWMVLNGWQQIVLAAVCAVTGIIASTLLQYNAIRHEMGLWQSSHTAHLSDVSQAIPELENI